MKDRWRYGRLAPKLAIIGGSQREERFEVPKRRIQSQGLNPEDLWWYLDLRRYGCPHAGFGLGGLEIGAVYDGNGNIRM